MKYQQKFLLGSIITAVLFVSWTGLLYLKSFDLLIDVQVQQLIQMYKSDLGSIFFKIITFSVSIVPTTIGVLLFTSLLWFRKKYRIIVIFLIAMFVAAISVMTLKSFFIRSRPVFENYNFILDQFSYPSGHATLGVVLYGFMTYWFVFKELTMKKENKKGSFFKKFSAWKYLYSWRFMKKTGLILGTLFVILIGVSRVYLGVHWFSDIVGGFLLGLAILQMLIWQIEKLNLSGY